MESSNFLPNSTAEQQKAKQTVMLCNHSDNTSKTSVEVNKTRFHSWYEANTESNYEKHIIDQKVRNIFLSYLLISLWPVLLMADVILKNSEKYAENLTN